MQRTFQDQCEGIIFLKKIKRCQQNQLGNICQSAPSCSPLARKVAMELSCVFERAKIGMGIWVSGAKKVRNISGDLGIASKKFKNAMRDAEEGHDKASENRLMN